MITIFEKNVNTVSLLLQTYERMWCHSSFTTRGHVISCTEDRTYGRTFLYRYLCRSCDNPPACATSGSRSISNIVSGLRSNWNETSSSSVFFLASTSPGLSREMLQYKTIFVWNRQLLSKLSAGFFKSNPQNITQPPKRSCTVVNETVQERPGARERCCKKTALV